MIVYHFTTHLLFPKIEREGLTKGGVPWSLITNGKGGTKVRFKRGIQWLTIDPEFDTQAWAENATGLAAAMMRKNDWRITIDVPDLALHRLMTWEEFAAHNRLPFADAANKEFGKRHTQHWRVFGGSIPTAWFVQTLQNPTIRDLVDESGQN